MTIDERAATEAEIIRKCLARNEMQCSFAEYRNFKVIYRRYASLFFIVGVDSDEENELAILEFIHALVETLDRYFENVVRRCAHVRKMPHLCGHNKKIARSPFCCARSAS